jgi:PPOX class probable F420-dependent enzyme
MKLTPAEINAFLSSTTPAPLATIATLQPDGAPHAVPVWFAWDDDQRKLVVLAYADSAWVRNLERDARVTVTVAEQAPPYTTVIARGRASLTPTSKTDSLPFLQQLAERYLSPPQVEPYIEDVLDTETVLVDIVPDSLTTWAYEFRSA